jgi:hypothetical protein
VELRHLLVLTLSFCYYQADCHNHPNLPSIAVVTHDILFVSLAAGVTFFLQSKKVTKKVRGCALFFESYCFGLAGTTRTGQCRKKLNVGFITYLLLLHPATL